MSVDARVKRQGARARLDALPLEGTSMRKTVRPLFRRRNDCGAATMADLPAELRRFGIVTIRDLRRLMKKHRRALIMDENVRMSRAETLYLAREAGFDRVDTLAGTSWFSLAGLVRGAMELEFGEAAAHYVTESQT